MNFNLPIFGFKPKKNERYSTIYLYDSITKSLPQDNTKISIYNFLLFLTYIPYQSMMSDITEKIKHNYKTFSIYNDGENNKLLFKIKMYHDMNFEIKCSNENVKFIEKNEEENIKFIKPLINLETLKFILQKNDGSLYDYFAIQNKNINHPFIRICKYSKKYLNSAALNDFIIKHGYSKNAIYKFKHPITKEFLNQEYFLKHGGHFIINTTKNEKFPMKFENDYFIHSLVWIENHALDVLKRSSFIELDCSFYVFKPYVYCIPHAIICNESLPLGLSIGPSESHLIYKQFYDGIEKVNTDAYKIIKNLPILSDEGKALKKFADMSNIIQYFCFRHIINKFGSNTPIAALVRTLLYCYSEEEYNDVINTSKDRITEILKESSVSQLKKFAKLFGFGNFPSLRELLYKRCTENEKAKIEELAFNPLFPAQSLWERSRYRVSTCSNHSESTHSKLNKSVRNLRGSNYFEIFEIVFACIQKRFEKATKRRNLSEAIRRVRKSASEFEDSIRQQIEQASDNCCSPTLRQIFYSSLYHCDFPNFVDVWRFKIVPFEPFVESDESSINIENNDEILKIWTFNEDACMEMPELNDVALTLIKVNGLPRRSFFDSIINLLPCPDGKRNNLCMFIRTWYVNWCANIYGTLIIDKKNIEEFGSFITMYLNSSTNMAALEEYKRKIDLFKDTRDSNILSIQKHKWAVDDDEKIINPFKAPKMNQLYSISSDSLSSKVQQENHQQYTDSQKISVTTLRFDVLLEGIIPETKKECERYIKEYKANGLPVIIDAVLYAMEIRPKISSSFIGVLVNLAAKYKETATLLYTRFSQLSLGVKGIIYCSGIPKVIGSYPISSRPDTCGLELLNSYCKALGESLDAACCACALCEEDTFFNCIVNTYACSPQKLVPYAIMGGSINIINWLKYQKCCFDDTFFIAVLYHHNDLFDFLLDNGKQKIVDENCCRSVFNNSAVDYINKNVNRFSK